MRGYAAGENSESKHWRKRAEAAEAERVSLRAALADQDATIQTLRGALADIAGSPDMTLAIARRKAKRIYQHTAASPEPSAPLAQRTAAPSPEPERMFPIMGGVDIPWSIIGPCEAQAKSNHDQTLERLAERGGLDPSEALSVLTGRPWDFYAHTPRHEVANNLAVFVQTIQQQRAKVPAPSSSAERKTSA